MGRLSRGIRIGYRHGFDSGKSLDYVYDNRARGMLGIGWLIDRAYLNAVGWRGIRTRRGHLVQLIHEGIQKVAREQGKQAVHLLDVATGCGRYMLDTIAQVNGVKITATLRDFDPGNVEQARADAAARGLEGITFEPGDAFDADTLADIKPRPDVAVVAGLYELFPENKPVLRSLRGLAAAIGPGGYLVYTGQPWHPQVEQIARTLPSHRGQAWVMRRRTQRELDQLVHAAGFEKVGMLIDEMGIFTVSLARRVQPEGVDT